jgi:hypothetical protein
VPPLLEQPDDDEGAPPPLLETFPMPPE